MIVDELEVVEVELVVLRCARNGVGSSRSEEIALVALVAGVAELARKLCPLCSSRDEHRSRSYLISAKLAKLGVVVCSVAVHDDLHTALKLCALLLGCARSEACVHLECVGLACERQVGVDVGTVGKVIVSGVGSVCAAHVDTTSCHVAVGVSHPKVFRLEAHAVTLNALYLLGHRRH